MFNSVDCEMVRQYYPHVYAFENEDVECEVEADPDAEYERWVDERMQNGEY